MVGTNAQVWNVLQTSLTVLQYRLAIKAYSNAQIALVLKMFDNVFSRFAIKENIPAGMEDASLIYQNVLQEVLVRMNIQRNVLMEHVQKTSTNVMNTYLVHLIWPIDVLQENAEGTKINAL